MARGLQKNFLGSAPGNMAFLQRQIRETREQEEQYQEARDEQRLDKFCNALQSRGVNNQPVQNITININVTPDQLSAISPERLVELIKIAEERYKNLSN